jgi:hypothetical protein
MRGGRHDGPRVRAGISGSQRKEGCSGSVGQTMRLDDAVLAVQANEKTASGSGLAVVMIVGE